MARKLAWIDWKQSRSLLRAGLEASLNKIRDTRIASGKPEASNRESSRRVTIRVCEWKRWTHHYHQTLFLNPLPPTPSHMVATCRFWAPPEGEKSSRGSSWWSTRWSGFLSYCWTARWSSLRVVLDEFGFDINFPEVQAATQHGDLDPYWIARSRENQRKLKVRNDQRLEKRERIEGMQSECLILC